MHVNTNGIWKFQHVLQNTVKRQFCSVALQAPNISVQVQLLHRDYNCQTRRDQYFTSYYVNLLTYLDLNIILLGKTSLAVTLCLVSDHYSRHYFMQETQKTLPVAIFG